MGIVVLFIAVALAFVGAPLLASNDRHAARAALAVLFLIAVVFMGCGGPVGRDVVTTAASDCRPTDIRRHSICTVPDTVRQKWAGEVYDTLQAHFQGITILGEVWENGQATWDSEYIAARLRLDPWMVSYPEIGGMHAHPVSKRIADDMLRRRLWAYGEAHHWIW